MLLQLRDIAAAYNGRRVLERVSLDVREGDFIGVIGPNGGGKSTLLLTILGLLRPVAGNILYKGSPRRDSLNIGYLPQRTRLDTEFPVRIIDVVLSGAPGMRGREVKQQARKLLDLTGIGAMSGRMVGELSGGEMQRVLIARALLREPELLLLDEPDTFVDSEFERDLSDLMQDLNRRMAIIMVSHDAGMISSNVKAIACVNHMLHYHPSNLISAEDLSAYGCPIDLITHGEIPHRVLHQH